MHHRACFQTLQSGAHPEILQAVGFNFFKKQPDPIAVNLF